MSYLVFFQTTPRPASNENRRGMWLGIREMFKKLQMKLFYSSTFADKIGVIILFEDTEITNNNIV